MLVSDFDRFPALGFVALQYGDARGWLFLRWKARFGRTHRVHVRTLLDYCQLLVACPPLSAKTQRCDCKETRKLEEYLGEKLVIIGSAPMQRCVDSLFHSC